MTTAEQIEKLKSNNEQNILSWIPIQDSAQVIWHTEKYSYNELKSILAEKEKLLDKAGFLVLIAENRLALSRWTGQKLGKEPLNITPRRDHTEKVAWTKKEIQALLDENYYPTFFYLSPNNSLVTDIWTDAKLPQADEYYEDTWYYGADRLQLSSETDALDAVVKENLYPEFCESFLVIIRSKKSLEDHTSACLKEQNAFDPWNAIYIHFSSRRDEQFETGTVLTRNKNGKIQVYKYPLTIPAENHIKHIQNAYAALSRLYNNEQRLFFNRIIKFEDNKIYFEYLRGQTLEDYLDNLLSQNQIDLAITKIKDYFQVLADGKLSEEGTLPITDVDCIFGNVYIRDDGYEISDYEWTTENPISWKFIEWRCLYYYSNYRIERKKKLGNIYQIFGISESDEREYERIEQDFQYQVSGNGVYAQSQQLRGKTYLGYQLINDHIILEKIRQEEAVQVYYDRGNNFSENDSEKLYDVYKEDCCELTFSTENVKALRIDPSSCMGVLEFKGAVNQKGRKRKPVFYNLRKLYPKNISNKQWVAINDDPFFVIPIKGSDKEITIRFSYRIIRKPVGQKA